MFLITKQVPPNKRFNYTSDEQSAVTDVGTFWQSLRPNTKCYNIISEGYMGLGYDISKMKYAQMTSTRASARVCVVRRQTFST